MFTDLFQLEQKPVTVFSSADVGAPVLTTDPGSLKTLLKACLVTGYGDKASLGWALRFESEDQKIAAFASTDVTASQFFFKIDNSSGSTASISAYQSMTGINDGSRAIAINSQYGLYPSSWRLIGHSKAFVLLLDVTIRGNKSAYPLLFGDLPREIKRTSPVCILWHSSRDRGQGVCGLQKTLFTSFSTGTPAEYYGSSSNSFKVNINESAEMIKNSYCRFKNDAAVPASILYEPVFIALSDATLSFLPMLQPLSNKPAEIVNLGIVNSNAITAMTGAENDAGKDNDVCAVPTDWWYS